MPNQEPALDFTKISFPTDRLTVRDLRDLFPDLFDRPDGRVTFLTTVETDPEFDTMLQCERRIAKRAFLGALGEKAAAEREFRLHDPAEDREGLTEMYTNYRLATGPHHAEQLIRDFEQAAAAQAKRYGPARR